MVPSADQQYIIDDKGKPTAVILPIEDYRKILTLLERVEDHRETRFLSQSPAFRKLVRKALGDIESGRIRPWKEVSNEEGS
ncbi:MAG: hypothetical protein AB1512_32035 [Thermodesulfobacteriota bacterium]